MRRASDSRYCSFRPVIFNFFVLAMACAAMMLLCASTFGQGSESEIHSRAVVETHECHLHELGSCGHSVSDEINIFGCASTDATKGTITYYNYHHYFEPSPVAVRITGTVTATEFLPAIYFAAGPSNPPKLLIYDDNPNLHITASFSYITTAVGDYYIEVIPAKGSPFGTGHYLLSMSCETCIVPSITRQPQNIAVQAGERPTLVVEANGDPPLAYAWHDTREPTRT